MRPGRLAAMPPAHVIAVPRFVLLCLGLLCIDASPARAGAQTGQPEPPRWRAEQGMRLREEGGVLHLSPSRGWLRTSGFYADFTLTLLFRLLDRDARADLAIRAPDGGSSGTAIQISNEVDGVRALGRLTTNGPAREASFDRTALARAKKGAGEWQMLRIEAVRDTARLFLNDLEIGSLHQLPSPGGYVTLASRNGRVEIRDTQIVRHRTPLESFGAGAVPVTAPERAPRFLRRGEPVYPSGMRDVGMEGSVMLELVVEGDGTVGDVRVIRSAHPDLDDAAIGAARRWTFVPGTKGGEPVAVVVRVQVTFKLEN